MPPPPLPPSMPATTRPPPSTPHLLTTQARPTPTSESSFHHSLARTACAQILYSQAERQQSQTTPGPSKSSRGSGHSRLRPIQASSFLVTDGAMDALADIVATFIVTVARDAGRRSRLVGRGDCNLLDVLGALERMRRVTQYGVKELAVYTMYQEVPFPYAVPEVPVLPAVRKRQDRKGGVYVESGGLAQGSDVVEGQPRGKKRKYVEGWMPELPSAHTYVQTPVMVKAGEGKRDEGTADAERRRVEKTLARLKETKKGSAGKEKTDLQKMVADAVPGNPFMSVPDVGRGTVFQEEEDDVQMMERDEGVRNVVEKESEEGDVDSNMGMVVNTQKGAAYEQKRQRVERILAESGAGGTVVSAKVEPSA